eukprot:evm.model.NODE_1652_length_22004_cov_31.522722.5
MSSSASASHSAARPVELIVACITGAVVAYSLLASYSSPPRTLHHNDPDRRKADEGNVSLVDGSGFAACIPPSVRSLLPRPRKRTDSTVAIDEPPGLAKELAIKVFVDTESDLRLIRRIHRDVKERGRSLESIVDQYIKTVRPMHMDFVEPSKREADVIIPLGMNQVALDMFLSRLQAEVADQLPDSTPRTPHTFVQPTSQKKNASSIALGKQGSLSLGRSMR